MLSLRIRQIRTLILSLAITIFLLSMARADSLFVDVTSSAVVTDGDGSDARLLMNISVPDELMNGDLIFAELRVVLDAVVTDSSVLVVHCDPLMIAWDSNDVAWEDLGDSLTNNVLGQSGTIYASSDVGDQEAYFDITEIIRKWTGGGLSNNGLILYCDPVSIPRFAVNREVGAPFGRVAFTFEP